MRSSVYAAIVLSLAILVTGCAERSVDEELLPTRVPQVDMAALVQAAEEARPTPRPTPTNTPVPPTPAPADIGTTATEDDVSEDSVVIQYGDEEVVESTGAAEETTVTPIDAAEAEDALPTAEPASATEDAVIAEEEVVVEDEDIAEDVEVTEPETDASSAATEEPDLSTSGDELEVVETDAAQVESPALQESVTVTDSVESNLETTIITDSEVITETMTAEIDGEIVDEPAAAVDADADAEITEDQDETSIVSEGDDAAGDVSTDQPAGEQPAEEESAGATALPDSLMTAIENADLERGEQLTLSSGCTGCHFMDPNQIAVGPTWYDLAATAAERVEGQSAELYLYNSIIHPNDYVVEGYTTNVMLQIYQDTLSEQDLGDIIGYLMTLRGR